MTKTKNKYEAHHLGGVLLLFAKAGGKGRRKIKAGK